MKPIATLQQAIQCFADADNCLQFMVERRWPDGAVKCPTCGSGSVSFIKSRRLWECKSDHARRQFSVKVGTVMEDSPLPLSVWLPAMWM
ncbi:MAG: transposase, partial [Terriglobales bacterium]